MRRVFGALFLLSILFATTLSSCDKETKGIDTRLIENLTEIKFEREIIDLGKLSDGEKVTCSFKFRNSGQNDLIISSVSANCGCTVADYPRDPISPGEEGMITVTYDSSNSSGLRITKEISILTNTHPSSTKLRIVAEVI